MSLLLRLFSPLSGRKVGSDRFGTVYYESRKVQPVYNRPRRWAVFAHNGREPTVVPPEWHAWLHHVVDQPLPERPLYAWQRDHQPNLTGTPQAYRPLGHDYAGGTRRTTGADYEAWTPGQ